MGIFQMGFLLGNYSVWFIGNSIPPACYFQGNSWKLAAFIIWQLQKTAGLGTSRNACQNCWIGHKQKLLNLSYWKIAGLRPAIFRGTPRNWGASISPLLWENCRGFAPAIFRGTLGNWSIHNFRYWNSWISRERKGTDQNAQLGTIRSVQLGTSRIFHHDQNEGQPLLPWLRGPRDNSRSCGRVIACKQHRKCILASGINLLLR